MSSDAEKLWEFICDSLSGIAFENEILFDTKDLYEITDAERKIERLLRELQASGCIGKYSCSEDLREIRIERKKRRILILIRQKETRRITVKMIAKLWRVFIILQKSF